MRCRERGSRLAEAHAELDDLLANVAELHEEEETHQKKKKKLRDKRKEDDERAETMVWHEEALGAARYAAEPDRSCEGLGRGQPLA
ncbi:hypothetical protein PR003_g8246 [Phytophthora rubi]|uniref:Uncharacterized protein n=1 Tax=Phytophthora rubi TaxID=129364 RepID=A0A6A3KTB8_9STRA|nr:hypothetical protein PR002_g15277 [Phytophthora rubi]KAE9344849.1 hypothetical protein PR003_g8246 [Phytophthora rubi]